MTSTINPQNIDGAYPVAGQDNDSQGFRDNFTNTRTNFQAAKDEITDIQNNAVLKAALTGSTLDNNMNGSVLSNAQLQNMRETVVNVGSSVSGAVTLAYATAPYYVLTTGGSVTVSFTGWPTTNVGRMRLRITVSNTAHTLTITPTGTLPGALIGASNVQGLDPATGTITFNQTGTYEFEFESSNAGTSISVFDLNRNRDPIYLPSSEDLAAAAAANLAVTTSYFSTAAAETATLAAGSAGQIKVFAMNADSGDMVITVTNPGWGGSGTITFSAVGQACVLMYINSKWFCVGNNGCVFA